MNLFINFTIVLITALVVNGMKIECDFKVNADYGYGCEVKTIENPTKYDVKKVCGTHMEGKTDKDVKYIEIKNSEMRTFPSGIANSFTELSTIKVDLANLDHICNEDLKEFGGKLQSLSLASTKIKYIPKDLFDSTPNLSFLYLESSAMENIQKGAFEPVGKLKTFFLKLTGNCKEDEQALTSDNVKELIESLEISCYKSRYTFPSTCKTTSGSDNEKYSCGKDTTLKPTLESSSTTSIPNAGTDPQISTTPETEIVTESNAPKVNPVTPSSSPGPDDESNLHWWIIGSIALIIMAVAGVFVGRKVLKKNDNGYAMTSPDRSL